MKGYNESIEVIDQGRRRRSGRSGYGRTTFLPKMVIVGPHFWPNIVCRAIFSRFFLDLFCDDQRLITLRQGLLPAIW